MNKAISPGKFFRVKEDPRAVMVGRLLKTYKFIYGKQTIEFHNTKRVHNFTVKQPIIRLSTGYLLGNYVYRKETVYRRVDGVFTPVVQYMRTPAENYSPLDKLFKDTYNDDPIGMLAYESEQTAGW